MRKRTFDTHQHAGRDDFGRRLEEGERGCSSAEANRLAGRLMAGFANSPGKSATVSLLHKFNQSLKTGWRRDRDSNPGYPCEHISFRD